MMTPIETRFRALNGKLQELLAYEQKLSRQQHAAAGDTFNLVIRSFLATLAVAIAGNRRRNRSSPWRMGGSRTSERSGR